MQCVMCVRVCVMCVLPVMCYALCVCVCLCYACLCVYVCMCLCVCVCVIQLCGSDPKISSYVSGRASDPRLGPLPA